MRVHTFPLCCGAGVLMLEHLTGKGKAEDLKLIKDWIGYAKRNGYRMYDFPGEYEGTPHDPMTSKAVLNSDTDKKTWFRRNSWGMLLAITNPDQWQEEELLKEVGFSKLFTTNNPVYGTSGHDIVLWGLDLNKVTKESLEFDPKTAKVTPYTSSNYDNNDEEDYDDGLDDGDLDD